MKRPAVLKVDRLVGRSVLLAIAVVWLILVGFDAFRIFVGELGDVGRGSYTVAKAASYTLLTIPRRLYEMFAYAAMIGALIGLGGLAGSGELTALRAAGLSKLRICASVVLSVGVLTVLVAVLGETVAPWGDQHAKALALGAKSNGITLAKGGSVWARDGETIVNAGSGRSRQEGADTVIELSRVRIFEFDTEGRLKQLSIAARAEHAGGRWTLFDARKTEFGADSATSSASARMDWPSGLDPGLLALSIVKLDYLDLAALARNIAYLERNGQDASRFREAWWERLFYPVNVLVLAFCALPFAFGSLRSGGLSKRLFIGIVLAIGFYFVQHAAVSMGAAYGIAPALANALPPLILIAAVSAWFRRAA